MVHQIINFPESMARLTLNIPDDLLEILAEIQRRERYRSPSEVLLSFIRHWALSQQEHAITGPWAALPGPERDQLDAGLLSLVKSGKEKKGSWLKARIYDAIKEVHGPDAKSPTVAEVLDILPEVARRSLTAKD